MKNYSYLLKYVTLIFMIIGIMRCGSDRNKISFDERKVKQRDLLLNKNIIIEGGLKSKISIFFIYSSSDCHSCIQSGLNFLDSLYSVNTSIPFYLSEFKLNDNQTLNVENTEFKKLEILNARELFYYMKTPILILYNKDEGIKEVFFIETVNTENDLSNFGKVIESALLP